MFDSVLGRGVAAPGRAGTGAALSLGLHALGLTLALILSVSTPKPVTVETIRFPPRPKPPSGPVPPTPTSPTRPSRSERLRPRPQDLRPAVVPEPPEPGLPPGSHDDTPTGDARNPPAVVCLTPPCADASVPLADSDTLDGNQVSLPRLLSGPQPVYPAEAARARIGGTALVRCTVTVEGTLEDCVVLRSLPLLDAPVLRALHARRYLPATAEGRPVPVRLVFEVKVVPPP